jgi:hypothetical protein
MLQELKKGDFDLYRDVVRYGNASISALQDDYIPQIFNGAQANAAIEVRERLIGKSWDFANYDHRVLMGDVATDLARQEMED